MVRAHLEPLVVTVVLVVVVFLSMAQVELPLLVRVMLVVEAVQMVDIPQAAVVAAAVKARQDQMHQQVLAARAVSVHLRQLLLQPKLVN